MIKQTAYLIAAMLLSAVVLQAQQTNEAPFAVVEKAVKEEQGGWNGNKERLSGVFDNERRRLGPQFEKELTKWLGTDPEKHYWISAFLDWEGYLHGNKRLPELSLLIKQQGLILVDRKDDDESKGYVIGFGVTAAILSDELGLRTLASYYKIKAEDLLRKDPSLSRYVPAVSEAERRRYDEIITALDILPRSPIVGSDSAGPPPTLVKQGVINGKATKLPKPVYPRAARAAGIQGTVSVRITFDETGKVISAKAIDGPSELHQASEDAAWQSEFTPVKLSGQPVKVTGVIIYNFVAR